MITLLCVLLICACNHNNTQSADALQSETDLSGRVVGVVSGTSYEIELTQRKDVKVVRLPTAIDCIVALKKGRIDAFVYDEPSINNEIRRKNGIKLAFKTSKSYPCGFAFRKEDYALVAQFNKFISGMKASGELQEIQDKWFNAHHYDSVGMTTDEYHIETRGKLLRVGTSQTIAPISFCVGKDWRGFEVEIAKRFGRYLGRSVEISLYDFAALAPALQSNAIDIFMGGVFITEEREKVLTFGDSHFSCYGGFFVIDENAQVNEGFRKSIKRSFNNNLLVENRWEFLARGLWVTIRITLFSIFFGTLLGVGLYLMRKSRYRWLNSIANGYAIVLRGIPMVVLLMILFYVIFTGFNALMVSIIAFSMTFACFASSMMNTSIQAVGNGQKEAGIALGFTRWQTFRYIIGPQALKKALPHFKSEAVSLIKNTSIVGYIAIQDLTRASDMIRSRTFEAFFPLLLITLVYFILAWLMSKLLDYLFKLGTKI
ncbi:MAG: ABC transporter permease subunit [Bacteroidales bacterium]|nr:ABC transporter permease subunit [Bacteroidales bacterium]